MPRLLALGASLAVGGCYLSHGREPVGPSVDAGASPDAPAALDAFVPPPVACALVPTATIQATATAYSAHAPRIGWDGEGIGLVVFESDGSIAHPVVSATRLPLDLSRAEPLRLAGEESHSWAEAAWDPALGHGVCWSGDPGGPSRTLFRLRRRDGSELAPRVEVDPEGGPCESAARDGGRWALLFRHGDDPVTMRVALIDDAGAVRATVELDEPAPYPGRGGQIAAAGGSFVAAQAWAGEGVVLTRIAPDGSSDRALVPAPEARYAALAAHDDGTIGIAIRDGAREEGGLRFVRVDRSLAPLAGETLLAPLGRGVRHPRVLALPDGWAILWVEQASSSAPATAAVLAHLDRDGLPREPRRVLVAGANSGYGGPSMAAHAGSLYVGISRDPEGLGRPEQAFVTRLECDPSGRDRCAAQDARPSGDDCAELTGFAWTGAVCAPIVCGCVGTECDRIAASEEECLADHAACEVFEPEAPR